MCGNGVESIDKLTIILDDSFKELHLVFVEKSELYFSGSNFLHLDFMATSCPH